MCLASSSQNSGQTLISLLNRYQQGWSCIASHWACLFHSAVCTALKHVRSVTSAHQCTCVEWVHVLNDYMAKALQFIVSLPHGFPAHITASLSSDYKCQQHHKSFCPYLMASLHTPPHLLSAQLCSHDRS